MTLEEFDKISNYFKRVQFCGQISDPIFNPDFIDMLKMCKDKNIDVEVSTAASHQPKEFYEKAFSANSNAKWVFGLDGFPKDSHKYRINQDGEKLWEMMKLAKSMGIKVAWQYIVFEYNMSLTIHYPENINKYYGNIVEMKRGFKYRDNYFKITDYPKKMILTTQLLSIKSNGVKIMTKLVTLTESLEIMYLFI